MESGINSSLAEDIDSVLFENAEENQNGLTVEFLESVLRESLEKLASLEYPFLDRTYIKNVIARKLQTLRYIISIDLIAIAELLVPKTEGEGQKKVFAGKLHMQAKKIIIYFKECYEKKLLSNKYTRETFLEELTAVNEEKDADKKMFYLIGSADGRNITEEIFLNIGNTQYRVSLKRYEKNDDLEFKMKDKLLNEVKHKYLRVKKNVAKKLKKIARHIRKVGENSQLAFELKPFLQAALSKYSAVEQSAAKVFQQLQDENLSPAVAKDILLTLDVNTDALDRYVNKIEKIFDALNQENKAALPLSPSMILDSSEKEFIRKAKKKEDSLAAFFSSIDLSNESEILLEDKYRSNMDWSIRFKNQEKPEAIPALSEVSGPIQKKSFLSKILSLFSFTSASASRRTSYLVTQTKKDYENNNINLLLNTMEKLSRNSLSKITHQDVRTQSYLS